MWQLVYYKRGARERYCIMIRNVSYAEHKSIKINGFKIKDHHIAIHI